MNASQKLSFTRKVRHAMNERLDTLPGPTAERLASARIVALSRKKSDVPVRVLAARTAIVGNSHAPLLSLGRIGLAIAALAMLAGLMSIFQIEQQRHIDETAEIEAAMLTDDLPVIAYADQGFNAYLSK